MSEPLERLTTAALQLEAQEGELRDDLSLNATALGVALSAAAVGELILLRSSTVQLVATSLQSALLLGAQLILIRGVRGGGASVARLLYSVLSSGLGWFALVEKWWILANEPARRQQFMASYRVMGVAVTLCGILMLLGRGKRLARYFATLAEHPARQTALSFAGVSLIGALLLTLPVCVRDPSRVSFLNALFMSTSAVCVTGLAVHPVAVTYSFWGQLVLLVLAQVGGLGIMVLSAALAVLTGRKLRARSSFALAQVLDSTSVATLRGSIVRIVAFSILIEAVGALLLYFAFARHPEVALSAEVDLPLAGSGGRAWAALFHAVSAFCNAGFSLTRDGFVPFVGEPIVCTIVMALIVLGGIGFPVLSELEGRVRMRLSRRRPERMSLHTRTALIASAGLIAAGALSLFLLEWSASFSSLSYTERMLAALFQSVSLRTAGFNTVDIAAFSPAALMLCCLMMFIGASPGGTGGGIKTTTFATLLATFRAEVHGPEEPQLLGRRLPELIIRRAVAVSFASAVALTAVVLSLLISEDQAPLSLVFEAVSAFGTVGLSTGVTPSLSAAGKMTLIMTMWIGRAGPLTLALAASERGSLAHQKLPHERVMIG